MLNERCIQFNNCDIETVHEQSDHDNNVVDYHALQATERDADGRLIMPVMWNKL